ncbi:MAG: DUF4269 domain-containing protein [Caldilineaceae bacterium]
MQKAKGDEPGSALRHTFVVAALLRRQDGILLVRQQGNADAAPYWAIPGGVVAAGEALPTALAREVKEESGLTVDAVGPLAYVTWIEYGPDLRATALIYEVTAWTGELTPDDPDGLVCEAAFFAEDEALTRLAGLPYRSMREPLTAYLRGDSTPGSAWIYRGEESDPFLASPAETARWRNPQVLLDARTERGRAAAHALTETALMENLATFTPTLIGTVPLAIDTPSSDLDVACFAPAPANFARTVRVLYAAMPNFFQKEKNIRGVPSQIAGFTCAGVDVQIFAQPQPVLVQYGFRHLLVEDRLLSRGGDVFTQEIRRRKASGAKTEPAFAELSDLDGDAYEALWWLSFIVTLS